MKIIPSKEVPPPDPFAAQGLLGPFLPQPPGVVLLSGETSAGKTVWAYNVAYCIAEGKEFAGLAPTASLPALYIDLESPEQVYRRMVEAIGRSDNLAFGRDLEHRLYVSSGQEELMNAIREQGARLVVIDPLSVAWPCRDENDNAEADAQMWRLKEIAVATDTLIVALWNMGEVQTKAKFRARGATARVDRVDQALNYYELSGTTRKLEIVKSRYGDLRRSITLQFAGDYGFELVEGEIVRPSDMQVIGAIVQRLVSEGPKSRQEVLTALREMGISNDNLVDKVLGDLCVQGKLSRVGRGMYSLPQPADSERGD